MGLRMSGMMGVLVHDFDPVYEYGDPNARTEWPFSFVNDCVSRNPVSADAVD